jgi:hypothetical protein
MNPGVFRHGAVQIQFVQWAVDAFDSVRRDVWNRRQPSRDLGERAAAKGLRHAASGRAELRWHVPNAARQVEATDYSSTIRAEGKYATRAPVEFQIKPVPSNLGYHPSARAISDDMRVYFEADPPNPTEIRTIE